MDLPDLCGACEGDDHDLCAWYDGAECTCECHMGFSRMIVSDHQTMDEPPNVTT